MHICFEVAIKIWTQQRTIMPFKERKQLFSDLVKNSALLTINAEVRGRQRLVEVLELAVGLLVQQIAKDDIEIPDSRRDPQNLYLIIFKGFLQSLSDQLIFGSWWCIRREELGIH